MKTLIEQEQIKADLGAVEQLLESLPPGRVAERRSLTARRAHLKEELEKAGDGNRAARALVLLSGEPVEGSLGIEAGFASRILAKVVATAEKAAASRRPDSGKGQRAEKGKLLVTGVATGSFGFEIQESDNTLVHTPMAEALTNVTTLLDAATKDDETFAQVAADMGPEVQKAALDMLKELKTSKANMVMATDTAKVDLGAKNIESAVQRAEASETSSEELLVVGVFMGALGESRRFEFSLPDGRLISGKVDEKYEPALANRKWAGDLCVARLLKTTVQSGGKAKSSHLLIQLDNISDESLIKDQAPGPKSEGKG